jgi:hypothetical protein
MVIASLMICLTQVALGYMGIRIALKPPQPKQNKWWIGAFVVVGALSVFLTGWVTKYSDDAQARAQQEIRDAHIEAAKANLAATAANAQATEAANAATSSARETVAARQDARRTDERLARLAQEEIAQTSGGNDNFCWALIDGPDESGKFLVHLIGSEGHALHNVEVQVRDEDRLEAWIASNPPLPGSDGHLLGDDPNVSKFLFRFRVGDMNPGFGYDEWIGPFTEFPHVVRSGERNFNITFWAANGVWSEEFRARQVRGRWYTAIHVTLPMRHGETNFRQWDAIDAQYPRNAAGKVDWWQGHD